MVKFYDFSLKTSHKEVANKILYLFEDFDIDYGVYLEKQYDVKLHKDIMIKVFLYSFYDISDCARRDEFLKKLRDLKSTYNL